jgi:hypothetical protein
MAYGVTRFAHMTPQAFKATVLDPSLGETCCCCYCLPAHAQRTTHARG